MVGVINPPQDRQLSTYVTAAGAATANRSPSTGPFGGVNGTSSTSEGKDPSTSGTGSAAQPSATGAAARAQIGGWVLVAAMGVAAIVV